MTRPQSLPIGELEWEDFERLCLRLLELDSEPVHVSVANATTITPVVRRFGRRGQAQDGIDVYARDPLKLGEPPPTRRYVSLQARRIKSVTRPELNRSVNDFLTGRWSGSSRKFIYATSSSTASTELTDAIEEITADLVQDSIEFVVWDQEEISSLLKDHPRLIDDFFGRQWVQETCGDVEAEALGTRLDAKQTARLRCELSRIYSAAFGVADSGLIAFRFGEAYPVALRDRFVTPDLVSTIPQATPLSQSADSLDELTIDDHDRQLDPSTAATWNALPREEGGWFLRNSARKPRRVEHPRVLQRQSADHLIGRKSRQVIVGNPGTGKSTILRYLILDLLSDKPTWQAVAEQWSQRLPVWLPFHYFTQRVAGNTGAPASVATALKAWLEQHDAERIWPLVKAALGDERLLIVVDGLDEWVSDEAGRYALAALETFADSRSIALIVSTRPYGLARLTLGAGWSYARIAPLTDEQQRTLAAHFFRAIVDTQDQSASAEVVQRSVDQFLSQVRSAPDLRAISGTPLFFVLLVGLHLSNVANLPAGRFDVYDRAVQLLVADHPARRRTAAAVTAPRQSLSDNQLRMILARVAYMSQVRGSVSSVPEGTLREDFIAALRDPNYFALDAADAISTADRQLDVAEGELGILVRKSPTELGFLHRMLQEQLAAEHISERLSLAELDALFAKHIGDARWREVLLATMWRLRRPSELHGLTLVIQRCIDNTPAGLRAREILAEVTFGPYNLPATAIQQIAPKIIKAIETHPYGPHRARLLDSVLMGLEGATTKDIVGECLERWALVFREPSPELVQEIGQLPPTDRLSDNTCELLVQALLYPDIRIAYASATAIAKRCSKNGQGSDGERGRLRTRLFDVLADPPSGLAASAALSALALGWSKDGTVADILNESRAHVDESVRIVALGSALGVLRPVLFEGRVVLPADAQRLSDSEREWLLGHLHDRGTTDAHWGLLVALVTEATRGQDSVVGGLVQSLQSEAGPYRNSELVWPVTLNVAADNDRVLEIVCDQLRSKENSGLILHMMFEGPQLLRTAYPPDSPQNARVAAAIEDRLRTFKSKDSDRLLFELASVDRGPMMKKALLRDISTASWPHWAAEALCEHFGDDPEIIAALHSVLMGDPIGASKIADVAPQVLPRQQVVPRLLAILRELGGSVSPNLARYDFVASSIVRTCREQGIDRGPEAEVIAKEALRLMPRTSKSPWSDPRYRLAADLYPSQASREVLAELADVDNRPIAPYLRAFRNEPEQVAKFLEDASNVLYFLPAYLRARLCQLLADRDIEPNIVLTTTQRWADDVSDPNKSIASLAYHKALLRAKAEGHIGPQEWDLALEHLVHQATCYGPDFDARRRAAWVGMCVCGGWSKLKARIETSGDSDRGRIRLADILHGPDWTLLQQLALRWEDLRASFGDTLLPLLSRTQEQADYRDVWDSLALVAGQSSTLEAELESSVASDPELLGVDGVLVWFVTRGKVRACEAADILVSNLGGRATNAESAANVLLADPERISLNREKLRSGLENAVHGVYAPWGDPALEALAGLFPDHPKVLVAWQYVSGLSADSRGQLYPRVHPRTHFAVAYAAVDACQILDQIELDLRWLDSYGSWYYDDSFRRHVSHRLRRDTVAAGSVRDEVMRRTTPDFRAAQLISILEDAVGLDNELCLEAERRIVAQASVRIAPLVRDHVVSATLSVRSVFTRVADSAWDVRMA